MKRTLFDQAFSNVPEYNYLQDDEKHLLWKMVGEDIRKWDTHSKYLLIKKLKTLIDSKATKH